MKRTILVLMVALAASPAFARMAPRMPAALEEAPVERAIENISADETLAPAQRERLLGRLHLIAYAQARAPMTRFSNGEWTPQGQSPCGDGAFDRQTSSGRDCPYGYAGLATAPELPDRRPLLARFNTYHLREARAHYERALALDDTNLRAHLGLAYVLDELNDDESARVHLRRILALADESFRGSQNGEWTPGWEIDAVLTETIEHLSDLARSRTDRAAVETLRQRLGSAIIVVTVTPIVVPLRDAPFDAVTDTSFSVTFDFAGTGDRRAQGWLTPDAAWLVWDPQGRGDIRSGFDLIGQRTWGVFWSDGFEAMRSLDDNGDGELAGAELGGLALWRDANSDGVSDAGEVTPLTDHRIVALSVRAEATRPGLLTASHGVRFESGRTRPLYDWTPGISAAPTS